MEPVHEVDLTIHVNNLGRDSVLAIAGPVHSYTVMASAEVKQELIELAGRESPKQATRRRNHTYAVMLYLVLASQPPGIKTIVIDTDLDKRFTSQCVKRFKAQIQKSGGNWAEVTTVKTLGTDGPAHYLARDVEKGRKKPDHSLSAVEVLELMQSLRIPK